MLMKRKSKKIWKWFETHMSPCIVVLSFLIVLAFTVITQILAVMDTPTDPTLIEYFYKFFGFEMLALSGIKISKHVGSAFGKAEEAIDGNVENVEEDNNDGEV